MTPLGHKVTTAEVQLIKQALIHRATNQVFPSCTHSQGY